jgi:hypothetical protein
VFIDGCFYPNNYPCGYAYPYPYVQTDTVVVPVPPGQPAQAAVAIDPITVAQAEAAAAIAQLNLARAAADLATARLQQLIGTTGQSQGTPPTPAEPSTAVSPPSATQQQDTGTSIQPQKASGDLTTAVDAALGLFGLIPIP